VTVISTTQQLGDVEQLRKLLDHRNEDGQTVSVSGMDATGQPFLAFVTGVYADGLGMVTDSPENHEVEPVAGRCDECGYARIENPEDLAYPITVMLRVGE
jgi:hypothetical protein